MPRKNYYYFSEKPKTSKVLITLNVIIIVLIVLVLSALGLYSYTFFTGKNPLQSFGIKMPWDDELVVSQPVVILPEQTETITTMTTTETSHVTANIVLTDKTESTEETSVTEPKYNSTEYDKSFFSNSLFIGDSIFTGFSGFGYLEPDNVFAQVGLNPESAVTKEINGVTAVKKAEEMQPDYICIMLGTNGLAFLSADYMAKEMSELVDSLRTVSPNSKIIILSIPPVTAAHESENPEKIPVIMDYNSKLLKTAEEKDCMYIDIFTMLQDDDGYLAADYAEADGLHFLGKAYGVVLSRIQYELELNEDDEASQTEPVGAVNSDTGISVETAVTAVEPIVTDSETVTASYTETSSETEITQ
ncbi:MAG: GDSL-type esterase/lipase family protein [Oscillospiraceae bacterium]